MSFTKDSCGSQPCESESRSVLSGSLRSHRLHIVRGSLQARVLEREAFPSPGDLPNRGIEPGTPAVQVDSLPAELPGKPSQP